MTIHKLKIDCNYLFAKLLGLKLFEIRKNDRDFQVGDIVAYEHPGENLNARRVHFEILYITDFMQKPGYIVFAEKPRTDLD